MDERKPFLSITRKDCTRQTFRSSGPGGQHKNKADTGVRWIHPPSGARGEASEKKSQHQNAKVAWRRMAESKEMTRWIQMQGGMAAVIDSAVDKAMQPRNLRIEGKDEEGRWSSEAMDTEGSL